MYQPSITIVGIIHSILYDIENTKEIVCQRSKINKTPTHLCVPLLQARVHISELFLLLFDVRKQIVIL